MKPYYDHGGITIYNGDVLAVLREMPAGSVQCVVTSPPYWGLRDYQTEGQIGLEPDPQTYIAKMVEVFGEVRRVLRDDGTLWCNIGDSYARQAGDDSLKDPDTALRTGRTGKAGQLFKPGNNVPPPGLKPKDLCMMPARLALALQADGWWLRSDIVWAKPNPMPESVTDRPTKAHEYIFLLTKSARYAYDADAVREAYLPATHERRKHPIGHTGGQIGGRKPGGEYHYDVAEQRAPLNPSGRNLRSVWSIATQSYPNAHFATFPEEIPRRCILAGTAEGSTVLDPFAGAGTTLMVAKELGRNAIGIELNPDYCAMIPPRLRQDMLPLEAS